MAKESINYNFALITSYCIQSINQSIANQSLKNNQTSHGAKTKLRRTFWYYLKQCRENGAYLAVHLLQQIAKFKLATCLSLAICTIK